MMRIVMKSLVMISAGMIFLISTLTCCCLGKLVHANGFVKTTAHACCHGKASSKESGSSACPHDQASVAQVVEGFSFDSIVSGKDFVFAKIVDSLGAYVQPLFLAMAYGGAPPGRITFLPLYLQYHTLRL